MKFLVLLTEKDHFDNWDNADRALRDRTIADFNAFGDAVRDRGTLIVGDALDRPEEARTLSPGVYNGGISLSGSSSVTLNPGAYYINGGGTSLSGSGVGVWPNFVTVALLGLVPE